MRRIHFDKQCDEFILISNRILHVSLFSVIRTRILVRIASNFFFTYIQLHIHLSCTQPITLKTVRWNEAY